VDIGQIAQKP